MGLLQLATNDYFEHLSRAFATLSSQYPQANTNLSAPEITTSCLYKKLREMSLSTINPHLQNSSDHDLAGVIFGSTLGFGFFVICHAVQRTRKICAFTIMTWLTILVTSVSAAMVFFNLENVVHRPLTYYIVLSILWAIQSQCVLQIIVSRIVLIWSNPDHIRWLRWGIFSWVALINVISIPARLKITDAYTKFTAIWEPSEKVLCLLTDILLNAVFIFYVRKTLISNGLTKYNELVKFNVLVIVFSIALDLGIVSLMFMHGSLPYESLNSLSGFVKLKTELLMNELIVKVMQTENQMKMISSNGNENSSIVLGRIPTHGYSKGLISYGKQQDNDLQGKRKQTIASSVTILRPQLRMALTAPAGGYYHSGLGSSVADLESAHSSSVSLNSPLMTSRSHDKLE
ncbi:hypothetical protein PCANC_12537 [Puccinia coronata f. sp. avenae]|uniref:Uncharacterized protein n=1 Tax=Puccinia coronata f. sp. avenae TaxID=200324 RepID=A0A2N5SSI4_9BASI|nr:hypothetical protein PCANC_12537 [Puccinia coronata f. sp. avenae]